MELELIEQEPVSEGHPTPILFIHGMWHAAWCWKEHFLPYFSGKGYKSYALSLRGHGGSEGRQRLRWTTLAEYVSDVDRVTNGMERPPVLVGHSMGGMIVQKYLESHEAPAGVLLASGSPKGVMAATIRVFLRHPAAFLKANLTLSMYPVVSTERLAKEAFFSWDMSEENVRKYFEQLQDESYRAYLDMLGLNLPKPEKVKTRMLVLGAAQDAVISIKEVEATAQVYNTEAEIFPDMAHDMMLEHGWETVAERIHEWLKEQGL